jgi:hypothetical protein
LRQNQNAGAELVPLQLDLVSLEESLLRDRVAKERNIENLDGSRLTLENISKEM